MLFFWHPFSLLAIWLSAAKPNTAASWVQQLEKSPAQAPTPGLDTVLVLLVDETQAASLELLQNSWDSSPPVETWDMFSV